jgi:hypothetical protein
MNMTEHYLYDAVNDAITPLAQKVEAGDTDIERYEPYVGMDLTYAYQEALEMEGVINSDLITTKSHMYVILPAVEAAFFELSNHGMLGVSPKETIEMLADALVRSLLNDIAGLDQSMAG